MATHFVAARWQIDILVSGLESLRMAAPLPQGELAAIDNLLVDLKRAKLSNQIEFHFYQSESDDEKGLPSFLKKQAY